jgi:class 3 adenylate cyclase
LAFLGVVVAALAFAAPQAAERGWRVALVMQLPGLALGYVGLVFYHRYRDRNDALLFGLGSLTWLVGALGMQSNHPVLRDVILMIQDVPFGFMVHLIVAVPGGRLRTRGAKFVVIASYFGAVVIDPLQILFAPRCTDCAVHLVVHADWPLVRGLVEPSGIVIPLIYGTGIAAYQFARFRRETAAGRRLFGPIAVASGIAALVFASGNLLFGSNEYLTTLSFAPAHRFEDVMTVVFMVAFTVAVLSFLVGIERANRGARQVAGLLPELFIAAETDLAHMIGDAIGDPTLTLDLDPAESAPPAASGRALTNVEVDGRVVARMNHDAALLEQPALLDAARSALAVLFGERMRTGDAELARQVRELRHAFAAYVDPELADEIAEGRQPVAGAEADTTLLFLDVRGFTAFSDGRDPGEVVARLNALWERVVPVITTNHGRANKFVGDGLLAVFGLEDPTRNHADDALVAARELAELLSRDDTSFSFGIGLNTGRVVVGAVGGGGRVDFTVIGDAVNTASRVEAVTRETGDAVLLSQATKDRLSAVDGVLQRGLFELKGKAEPVRLYALPAASAASNS